MQSPEELYAAALDEGVLTIYTVSTRMLDVAASFEAEYPGLSVKVLDIRADELANMVADDALSGAGGCDLIFCTDVDGAISRNFIPNGLAHAYFPPDIADKLTDTSGGQMTPVVAEIIAIAYNDAVYSQPPVSNWWALTQPEWYGRVYCPNPARSVTTLAAFTTMLQYEALWAQSYEEYYGKPFADETGEGAAKAYLRALVENGLFITNSSDEVIEAEGAPSNQSPGIGIMVSSKLRMREIGYSVAPVYDAAPYCGVVNPIHIMIADGSPNVNSAKLFVRWLLGEADGQGAGYAPYLQNGAWSMRTDVDSQAEVALAGLDVRYTDGAFVYDRKAELLDFWQQLIAENY